MLFPWYEPFLLMWFATSITCICRRKSAACFLVSCCFYVAIVIPATMATLRFNVALSRGLLTFVSQPI